MATTHIKVRGYHLDGYGHVNNARYLEFLEEARWAYFEQYRLLDLLGDIQMVVARVDIHYRRSATFGDVLHIHSHIQQAEARKVTIRQTILLAHNQKTVAYADITLMPVQHQRSISLPSPLLQQLNHILTNNNASSID